MELEEEEHKKETDEKSKQLNDIQQQLNELQQKYEVSYIFFFKCYLCGYINFFTAFAGGFNVQAKCGSKIFVCGSL